MNFGAFFSTCSLTVLTKPRTATLSLAATTSNIFKHVMPVTWHRRWDSLSYTTPSFQSAANTAAHNQETSNSQYTHPVLIGVPKSLHKVWKPDVFFFWPLHFLCLASHRIWFMFASNTIGPTSPPFRIESCRIQSPPRCRPCTLNPWILGSNHATITRPALARVPSHCTSCMCKHQRCNSRSSLSKQRTLKISLVLPIAHSVWVSSPQSGSTICKTRTPNTIFLNDITQANLPQCRSSQNFHLS